ncbi:hypothetical protein Gasu2_39030 [Galdieria sulphuraria]|uniref:GLTSCR protein conserved domain-containing protein n=1 Tax=Galdieria sulphuraria TaxID=130081 RepID=M2Y840_GALSU|nr:uncharacterized protein Gasu_06470 [Galdieria sulphuraria]EME32238.1 hypothetical protein Gasu_06470 [Galdieria sulphuraria]GJD09662.1 hypothetical protein Gasu2_39030 [Galdieria sulphuraria]|eukprot:XP_005708758.1 hypothetical protein Gasu_06470 [Galdieria sulphuraria]
MEEFEDEEAKRESRILSSSNSRGSCYCGGTDSDSKETRQQGSKTLSSETLKNLCRALNDPSVSVEVKKRIGVLLRQLQQRYLERNHNSVDEQMISSSYVKESFQAAVASGVVSHFESERQRSIINTSQPPKIMKAEAESLETFPRIQSKELGPAPLTRPDVSKRVRTETTKSPEEIKPFPKTYSAHLNSFGGNDTTDSSIRRVTETKSNSFTNTTFVDTRTENQVFEKNLLSMQDTDFRFLSGTECVPLNENSAGRESNYIAPTYQSFKEIQTGSLRGRTSAEELSSQQHVSSIYSDKSGKWPHKREGLFMKQENINNNVKILPGHENNKNLNVACNNHLVTNSGKGFGSSSSIRQDYAPYQSSSSSQDKKRLRLLSAPQKDLQAVLHPNYRTPFVSLEDACQRLMPYHLWYIVEDGLEKERKQEWEASYDKVYKKLKQNLSHQEDRYNDISKLVDSEQKVDVKRTTPQVIETSVLDDILASNFLLKET